VAGEEVDGLYVENDSAGSCWVSGYPRVELDDAAAKPISLTYRYGGTQASDPTEAATQFMLLPGDGVGFNIEAGLQAGRACWQAARIAVGVPGEPGIAAAPTGAFGGQFRGCGETVRISSFLSPIFDAAHYSPPPDASST
jgi:hypothetical protein